MQLILTHADLEAALINDLRSKGMTAFEPGKASVEFSFKRGTKELVCTLDTEAKAEPVAADPKPAVEVQTTSPEVIADAVLQAGVAQAADEAGVSLTTEAVATTAVETQSETGADDNLFD